LQLAVGWVVHSHQRQTPSRRGSVIAGAAGAGEQLSTPVGGTPMLADRQKRADQRSHHRPAERVGGDVRGDQIAVALPVEPLQVAYRGGPFAVTAKRGEV